jgi:hypothetical protein
MALMEATLTTRPIAAATDDGLTCRYFPSVSGCRVWRWIKTPSTLSLSASLKSAYAAALYAADNTLRHAIQLRERQRFRVHLSHSCKSNGGHACHLTAPDARPSSR